MLALALTWPLLIYKSTAQQQPPCLILSQTIGPDPCYSSSDPGCTVGIPGNDPAYCDEINATTVVVRVYANIIRGDDGTGGRTLSSVNAQLQEMIDVFMPLGIIFSIEAVDEINSTAFKNMNTYHIGLDIDLESINDLVAQYSHPDGIDIYFCEPDPSNVVLGIGVLPSYDGTKSVALIGNDWGYVLAHEMGHVLGLLHTFEACSSQPNDCDQPENYLSCDCGDYVWDTPYTPLLNGDDVDGNCQPLPPLP